ncbi:hypothetical protein Tco_1501775 [Tanacetum coccineum]
MHTQDGMVTDWSSWVIRVICSPVKSIKAHLPGFLKKGFFLRLRELEDWQRNQHPKSAGKKNVPNFLRENILDDAVGVEIVLVGSSSIISVLVKAVTPRAAKASIRSSPRKITRDIEKDRFLYSSSPFLEKVFTGFAKSTLLLPRCGEGIRIDSLCVHWTGVLISEHGLIVFSMEIEHHYTLNVIFIVYPGLNPAIGSLSGIGYNACSKHNAYLRIQRSGMLVSDGTLGSRPIATETSTGRLNPRGTSSQFKILRNLEIVSGKLQPLENSVVIEDKSVGIGVILHLPRLSPQATSDENDLLVGVESRIALLRNSTG